MKRIARDHDEIEERGNGEKSLANTAWSGLGTTRKTRGDINALRPDLAGGRAALTELQSN